MLQGDGAADGGKRKRNSKGAGSSKKAKNAAPAKSPTQQLLPLIEGELRSYQLKGARLLVMTNSSWTDTSFVHFA